MSVVHSIEAEYKRSSNAARLLELGQTALGILSENDGSLLTQAGALGRTLQELQRVDASATALVTLHEQSVGAWRDLQANLSRYVDSVELDPARLHEIEQRLNLIHTLRRKYGSTVADVIAFGADARLGLISLAQAECSAAASSRVFLRARWCAAVDAVALRMWTCRRWTRN